MWSEERKKGYLKSTDWNADLLRRVTPMLFTSQIRSQKPPEERRGAGEEEEEGEWEWEWEWGDLSIEKIWGRGEVRGSISIGGNSV